MVRVCVFSSEHCPYCRQAKTLLEQRHIPYEEIVLSADDDVRAALAAKTGMRTFPQIIIDGKLLGGLRELVQADLDGSLEPLGLTVHPGRELGTAPPGYGV